MRINGSLKKADLDAYDRKIIRELQEDARISYTQLGKAVRLGRDTVSYRVKKLEEEGVIERYSLDANFRIFGYDEYHVLLQVLEAGEKEKEKLVDFLKTKKGVVEIISYMDKWDLKFTVLCEGVEALDEVMTELYGKFSNLIIDEEVLEKVRDYVHCGSKGELKFDETDRKILNVLSDNSRKSLVDVAKDMGIGPDAIMYRMKEYDLVKYAMQPQINRLGLNWYTVLLEVNAFGEKEETKIRKYVSDNDSFTSAFKVIGNWHLVMTLLAEDQYAYHLEMKKFRKVFSDLVKDFDTLLAYKERKYDWKV